MNTLGKLSESALRATPRPWDTDLEYLVGRVPSGRPGGEVIARFIPTVSYLTVPNLDNANFVADLVTAWPDIERALRAAAVIKADLDIDGWQHVAVGKQEFIEALATLFEDKA